MNRNAIRIAFSLLLTAVFVASGLAVTRNVKLEGPSVQILGLEIDFIYRPAHASVHRIRFGQGRRVIESLNEHQFLRKADMLSY